MKIKVLYEDKDILAIEKPSGILVHPDEKSKQKTIFDIFVKKFPKLEIAHRLDRETSGVLLLAKNKKAHEALKEQFQARTIKKVYNAIVNSHPRNERAVINKPIGRSPKDFRRWLAGRGARGELREAITEYRVLKKFEAPYSPNFSRSSLPRVRGGSHTNKNSKSTAPFSFLEIRPKTGRTHQIRVHMKFANYPVACDSLYNPGAPCPKGIKRVALHASSIEFENSKGERIKVVSPLPKEFAKVVK